MSNKISIPKHIFEKMFFQNGGEKPKQKYTKEDVEKISPRVGERKNKDKSVSTHLMTYTSADGKFFAYPTLFQNKDGKWVQKDDSKQWEAFKEAQVRGELFEFDTEEDAKNFAEGNWKYQNGGEAIKSLTGQFITEVPHDSEIQPNAEIEDQEYVKTKGTVKKAVGETHENGGIEVALDGGDRVLSDHLKVGRALAKQISKDFDIEVSSKDTYAKVLDKYLKKIGHTKTTKELEETIDELDKQEKLTKDEATLAINSDFLMKKINDKGAELDAVEAPKQQMFDLLYTEQEASKKPEFKNGGSLEEKYGMSFHQKGDQVPYTNPLIDWARSQSYRAEYDLDDLNAKRERYRFLADNAGVKTTEDDFKTHKSIDNLSGRIQQTQIQNNPELAHHYGLQVEPTRQGLQYLVDNNIFTPSELGIKLVNGKVPRGSYDTLSGDVMQKINDEVNRLPEDKQKEFSLKNYYDNLGYFRGLLKKEQELSKEDYDKTMEAYKGREVGTSGYFSTDVPGVYIKPTMRQPQPQETPPAPAEQPITTNSTPPITYVEPRGKGFVTLPDINPMAPPAMRAPMKFQPRVYSGERVEISPDQALSEINRSQVATQRSLDSLPDSVRASSVASLDANLSQNISKVVSDTERYNAQARERESYEDASVRTQQSNLDAQSAAQYQQLMGAELEGYEHDLHNYYNQAQRANVNNWKHIEMLNKYNALNPDVQFNGQDYVVTNLPEFTQKKQNGGEVVRRKFKNRFAK